MTVWIALHLPRLPLEAQPAVAGGSVPAAIAEARALLYVNAAAAQQGVTPGMGIPSARGRCAALQVHPRDLHAEQACLDLHVHAALRYTPRVVVEGHTVGLEVQASLRLFGGAQALWSRLEDELRATGLTVWMAAAPTLSAALLFARLSDLRNSPSSQPLRTRSPQTLQRWLDALPADPVASQWGLSDEQRKLLQGLGVRRLGDVRAFPRDGLVRRGLETLLSRLDQARGEAAEAWAPVVIPEGFDLRYELPFATDAVEAIRTHLQPLLQALQGWTMVRQRSVEQVSLFLIHDSLRRQRHPDTVLPHRWLEPECDPSRWERGLMERVARESLPAPVRTLRLRLDAHQPAPAETAGLAGVAAAPARRAEAFRSQRARLIEDLTARLGADRVRHLKLHPDHRPERASALVDPTSSDRHPQARRASPPSTASSAPAGALLRPAWLLPQPQALEERAGHLWWGHQRLEVVGRPERIESGWFDGDLQCRDYHWARTPEHRWAWVYRQRRSAASPSVNLKASAPAPPDAWFLQGWFT